MHNSSVMYNSNILKTSQLSDNKEVKYSVFSVPSMLVFKGGEEAGRIVGALPPTEITKKFNKVLQNTCGLILICQQD